MGYLTVLYKRLGVKIRDRHAKDSNAFRKRLIGRGVAELYNIMGLVWNVRTWERGNAIY